MSRGWESLFQAIRRMPLLFLCTFGLFVLLQSGSVLLNNRGFVPLLPDGAFYLLSATAILMQAVVETPVAVAVQRWILLGETELGPPSWSAVHTRIFLLWMVAEGFVFAICSVPSMRGELRTARGLAEIPFDFSPLLSGLFLTAVMFASLYVALVFPAVAIGETSTGRRERLRVNFARMRGNYWLLVRAAIWALVPVYAFIFLENWLIGADAYLEYPVGPAFFCRVVLDGAWTMLGALVLPAMSAWLFEWVRSSDVTDLFS